MLRRRPDEAAIRTHQRPRAFQTASTSVRRARPITGPLSALPRQRGVQRTETAIRLNVGPNAAMKAAGRRVTNRLRAAKGDRMNLRNDTIRPRVRKSSGAKRSANRLRRARFAEPSLRRRATAHRHETSSGHHRRRVKALRRARRSGNHRLLPPARALLHVRRSDRRNARRNGRRNAQCLRADPTLNSGLRETIPGVGKREWGSNFLVPHSPLPTPHSLLPTPSSHLPLHRDHRGARQ